MKATASAALCVCITFAAGNIGCMRGMTYKMPMPDSMTLGTMKEEGVTLASANKPSPSKSVAQAGNDSLQP